MGPSEPISSTMFWSFACLHLFSPILRSFCSSFALVSLMTLPKLSSVNEREITELDFCSIPKQMLESNLWRKTRYSVSICVWSQRGGICFHDEAPGWVSNEFLSDATHTHMIVCASWKPFLRTRSTVPMKYKFEQFDPTSSNSPVRSHLGHRSAIGRRQHEGVAVRKALPET